MMNPAALSRRNFLVSASASAASMAFAQSAQPNEANKVQLPQIHAAGESDDKAPDAALPDDKRIGYAIVGLGRLSINQILPAFGASKYSRPTALVSGDRAKAEKIAAQYGIPSRSIYDYSTYDQLKDNPAVQAIFIVLPNSMHEEYVLRGAKTGKHILCEKPMATSSKEAQRMIDACKQANVKLMIAYRQQYEPANRALRKMITEGKLGKILGFVATNSQNQGDPAQWRLKKALAGGGALPDVGLYCLNAVRFQTGEEPIEVSAQMWQPKDDPRFKEVEASVSFSMKFASGLQATCTTSYDVHKSQYMRIEGTEAWAEMSPAFAYHGNKVRYSKLMDGKEMVFEPQAQEKDQFALEMDHFSECILEKKEPHTPGEEGLQDHRIIEAIYGAAASGKSVKIAAPNGRTRGPELEG